MSIKYGKSYSTSTEIFAGILIIALALSAFAAWVTHVVVCLQTAQWGFLIAGAILAPIAAIHGYGIWFGWF